jgi:hypothetical protein
MSDTHEQAIRHAEFKVRKWDMNNIQDLRDLLNDVEILLKEDELGRVLGEVVDMLELPSASVGRHTAEELNGENGVVVWAMDKKGYCLVGADAKSVMHVSEIIGK